MINETLIKNWKLEQALSYLFLSVANSDYEINSTELTEIKNILYQYTKSDDITDSFLKEVLPIIKYQDIEDKKNTIHLLKTYFFNDVSKQKKLLEDIEEIIIADMMIETNEMEMFHFIKKLFKPIIEE